MPSTAPPTAADTLPFPEHLQATFQGLRAALTEALAEVGADAARPLPLARRLGLDKSLAWKLARLVQTADAFEAARHVPGPGGLRKIVAAFRDLGAEGDRLAALQTAVDAFDRMVETHCGDRATLALMVGSMAPDRVDPQRLEASRKLSFQGNGATWGVQAKARVGVQLIAPSPVAPGEVDITIIGGLVDLRRLRPAPCPLLYVRGYSDDPDRGTPDLVPLAGDGTSLLLDEFCSTPRPEVRALAEPDGTRFELKEGPVGHTAASTCLFAWKVPRVGPMHGENEDDVAELFIGLHTPVEAMVFDVLVHRDLPFHGAPDLNVYSLMHGQASFPTRPSDRYAVPCADAIEELGSGPPVLATPLVPRHREMVETVSARAGLDLGEFRGYRLTLRYPPIPALPTMSYPLPPTP